MQSSCPVHNPRAFFGSWLEYSWPSTPSAQGVCDKEIMNINYICPPPHSAHKHSTKHTPNMPSCSLHARTHICTRTIPPMHPPSTLTDTPHTVNSVRSRSGKPCRWVKRLKADSATLKQDCKYRSVVSVWLV